MNYKLLFKTAMLAGEIMAQSGAETFRVEDTMNRILSTSHLQSVEVYATTTGIVASLSDPLIETISGVARISNRANNLSRIHDVNQISRNICDGRMTLEDANEQLLSIRDHKIYSKRTLAIATVVSTIGFAGLFGGTIADCIIAAINGLIIVLISRFSVNLVGSAFMGDAAKCFAIAFVAMLSTLTPFQINKDIVIIGSIMPLVPGIPITNAIRDTLQGDYNSGTARAVEAFVISLGIAMGVGAGIGLFNIIGRMSSLW
ncbi:MAG TPA: threonine/serine exporter family protein [Mobilitalea sp.]|nr:threonine/serine exporter family protein [Mobilitalea sp.]